MTLVQEIYGTFKYFQPDYFVDSNPVWNMGLTEADYWPDLDLDKQNHLTHDGEKPELYFVE